MSGEREEHAREVSSLAEARDTLQEKLREMEGEREKKGEVSPGDERSRELLDCVEEMNRKTSASLVETKEKTKVSCSIKFKCYIQQMAHTQSRTRVKSSKRVGAS